MAHNLHLITIRADTPHEACSSVEDNISEWGTDNNWRVICGCVSENNEIYLHNEGGGSWLQPGTTISDITTMVKNWANNKYKCGDIDIIKLKFKISEDSLTRREWLMLKKYIDYKYEQFSFNEKEFELWGDTYRDYQYNEVGLTNMLDYEDGKYKYVVFIDMHN